MAGGGDPVVHDVVDAPGGASKPRVRLRRQSAAFFQGNRYLLQTLVDRVLTYVPDGPLSDLYAGGGLFGLAYAAPGAAKWTRWKAMPWPLEDLRANATPYSQGVRVHQRGRSSDFWPRRGALDGRTADRGSAADGPVAERRATLVAAPARAGWFTSRATSRRWRATRGARRAADTACCARGVRSVPGDRARRDAGSVR